MSKYKSFIKELNITNNMFSYRNRWKLSNNILYKKYSSFKYSYASICINNLMFNEKCRIVSRFKDYLIYDDDTEFCRTNYKKDKLRNTLIKIYNFYDKYNKVFPNYMILPENIYMYKNLRRKQKLIDINIEMIDKKNKVKDNNNNNENKKENLILFDEQVRANINRQNNSNITISLTHTFISNYTSNFELKKNENVLDKNKSFVESSINNSSFNISLYSKRSIFNDNNPNNYKKCNKYLYDNSIKSEASLENVVDALNCKKFNKNKINKRKNKCLGTNSISNNTNDRYNDKNKTIISTHKTQNWVIKTPFKNRLYKCERKNKLKNSSINNNEFLAHKKTTSDSHVVDSMMKNTTEFLSNKRILKFASRFQKEEAKYNTIENITSSILDRYKNINKLNEDKNKLKLSTKIVEHLAKTVDNQKHFNKNFSKSKENNRSKFNNYFTFKLLSKRKFPNNNDYMKYNKITNMKRKKTEDQITNRDNSKKDKLYSILEERLRINFNKKVKEKNKLTAEADSTIESTKLSLNNRKTKFNFYTTNDKPNNANNLIYICDNNNKNKTNQQILKTIPKDENILNNYNYNTLNNNFKISNIEFAIINNNTHGNNINKKYQKQNNAVINNSNKFHKKNKTYSLNMINDNELIFSFNKKSSIYQKKINYLDIKLKKIQEKIIKNKNNFKLIKEKERRLSESIKKKMFRNTPTPSQSKRYNKMVTSSTLNQNNSLEKRFKKEYDISKSKSKSKSKSRNKMKGIVSKINYKKVKRNSNTIDFLHQRNYSLFNNNIKSPFAKKIIRESIKENAQKNKDKIKIVNKRFNLKIKCMKK